MQVVKQLCVAGEHAATRRTGDKALLSMAPHMFPQTVSDLEKGVAACEQNGKCHTVSKEIASHKHLKNSQSYLPTGRRAPAVVEADTVVQHFLCGCPHVDRTTQDY